MHLEAASLFPELFERRRAQFRVMRRVLNIDVAEPQLESARVVPRIGKADDHTCASACADARRATLRVRPPPRSSLRR
jgi:hypothetical protein